MADYSYQLYSSRNFPPLSGTLAMIAGAGYTRVEGYGALYAGMDDAGALRGMLDDNRLTMPTAHVGLDMIEDDPGRVIEIARALGIETVFCPHLAADLRPADAAGWLAFGRRLAAAGAALEDAGLRFGWHNHDFEFTPLPDGSVPMTHILAGGPGLAWEMDVAWIVRGGGDPIAWIRAEGARVTAVHVKDIAPEGTATDEDGWADVGHGTMDWAALMTALRATPAAHFIVEHDNPNDAERFARRTFEWLSANGGASA